MDPHVVSIVSHLILHAIEDFGGEKGITAGNFDQSSAEHETFAKEAVHKLVSGVFEEFKKIEALRLSNVPVVPGANTVN